MSQWLVLTGSEQRAAEARGGAAAFLEGGPAAQLTIRSFRDGFLPSAHADVKATFESLKGEVRPDLILTHRREDLHQDHRLAAELTWNTFRDHLILEYEIAKYEGDLGNPNVYVPLPEGGIERKIERLLAVFSSQRGRDWFDPDTFRGLARIRGMECRAESGYAEAFTGRKLVL